MSKSILKFLFMISALGLPSSARAEDHGLRVPPGFRVTLFSGEDLANDIYAMSLDGQGRVVVTSAGWIKRLEDTKGTGKADKATVLATTPTGGMGLCFDGDDLLFCGEGWFSRYGLGKDGQYGTVERIAPMQFGEHCGHAMRKGPDGYWYLIGGNDSGISRKHISAPHSLVRDPEAGGILRFTPDLKQAEVIAHGFRNPYDFDFNEAGDLFTYDSDVESDFFLPWYSPTRIYHVGLAGHHGWRLTGWRRSWCRRDFYLDTVDILAPIGRGSPTGVVCYRHDQFPKHYRGGVFALDWTFGKVYFLRLQPDGATYRSKPEVFMESIGANGFAPTDAVVAPDGALLLSIGGRKTRGSVYRIEYVGDGKTPVKRPPPPSTDLDKVLYAHQPLDEWSRAQWMPLARKLGAEPFAAAVAEEKLNASARVRAIEVLTELFGGLPERAARASAQAGSPLVRARVAWSLGRAPCSGFADLLKKLVEDQHPKVRAVALTAFLEQHQQCADEDLGSILVASLGHADKRVRQAAARLAAIRPEPQWKKLQSALDKGSPEVQLGGTLAAVWRAPETDFHPQALDTALTILAATKETELRLQALRLIQLALGDWRWNEPSVEVYTAYELASSLKGKEETRARVLKAVQPLFPAEESRLNEELARLLAMLEDNDPALPGKVVAFWTKDSTATQDLHYLIVLSRLRGPRDEKLSARIADVILGLHRKLEGQEQRIKQNWSTRLAEVITRLLQQDRRLAAELLKHSDFARSAHVLLANALGGEERQQAGRLFLAAVKKDTDFVWSGPLIELLGQLPAEDVRPVLRGQWSNFALRDAILPELAEKPEEADRAKFLTGLESSQSPVIRLSLTALEQLPRDTTAKNVVPLLQLLRRLQQEPKEAPLRGQALGLLERQTGQPFSIKETETKPAALKQAYQPVFDWFARAHPALVAILNGGEEDWETWSQRLKTVPWDRGSPERGAVLYRDRACLACHSGTTRLGPDLTGVTSRFSREDLFQTILSPSRDVAPLYRTTLIQTDKGIIHSGLVIFESADGVILQTGATTTLRLATTDIANRQPSSRSLMPDGLLKDLKLEDLADLYAYLQTPQPKGSEKPKP